MREFWNGFTSFLGFARGVEEDSRKADELAYVRAARLRAMMIERHYLDRAASGNLGDATLGDLRDAERADLFNTDGLFLGALDGRFLYLNSDGHHLVYARAGAGKGISSIQPALAQHRMSMLVMDLKDGELHYSSAEHRAETLGHDIWRLDPWGITGKPSVRVNPLHRLGRIASRGRIDAEADEIALMLLPKGKAEGGENGWALKGARRLLVMRMKYLAYEEPDKLKLSELWRFFNCSDAEMESHFLAMSFSLHEDVAGPAAAMKSVFADAPRQFEAYRADCIDALAPYSPGSALALATDENDVSFGEMKHRSITVYLCVPSAKLGVAAPWNALTVNHVIEEIAAEIGPNKVRLLLDEFAQMPAPIPAVMKTLRLYRGRGILLSIYTQGRFSLEDAGYSAAAIKEIEDQAACFQTWAVEDPSLLKDIEYWSGNRTVVQLDPSHAGGVVAQGSVARKEEKRAVLQVEDIRRINENAQIMKLPGFPLFVIERVPYWRVTPWNRQLRDVRTLHFGGGHFAPPLPPAADIEDSADLPEGD